MVASLGVGDVACMGQRSTRDGTKLGMLPTELVAREMCTVCLGVAAKRPRNGERVCWSLLVTTWGNEVACEGVWRQLRRRGRRGLVLLASGKECVVCNL